MPSVLRVHLFSVCIGRGAQPYVVVKRDSGVFSKHCLVVQKGIFVVGSHKNYQIFPFTPSAFASVFVLFLWEVRVQIRACVRASFWSVLKRLHALCFFAKTSCAKRQFEQYSCRPTNVSALAPSSLVKVQAHAPLWSVLHAYVLCVKTAAQEKSMCKHCRDMSILYILTYTLVLPTNVNTFVHKT